MKETRATRGIAEPPARPQASPLRLVLQSSGTAIELKGDDLVIGRHTDADIRLPLPDVSRHHCRLVRIGDDWHVRDMKSLNGIFVNDKPVTDAPLRHGDRLRIGGFTFTVDQTGSRQATGPSELIQRLMTDQPQVRPSSRLRRRAS